MGVNITTIDYLRILIIEIGSTINLMVVEAHLFTGFFSTSQVGFFRISALNSSDVPNFFGTKPFHIDNCFFGKI